MQTSKPDDYTEKPTGIYTWDSATPRGVMLIVHGLAEHAGRYGEFARYLNGQHISVVAYDQRGHGLSIDDQGTPGFVAPRRGLELLLQDIVAMRAWIGERYPDMPVFILGHSMGSFLVRCHLADPRNADGYQGAIISATGPDPGITGRIGLALASLRCTVGRPDTPSPLLDKLTFGAFGKPFRPLRTRFDWLSRDRQAVDAYIADSYCGFISSASLYRDLLRAVIAANARHTARDTRNDLPLLFIAGDRDPVGRFGKGVVKTAARYERSGSRRLTLQLYPGGRHEMLQEENRTEVFAQIAKWVYSGLVYVQEE